MKRSWVKNRASIESYETYHNRSRFPVINDIVCVYIPGKENLVVLDVVSDVGCRAAAIGVDPLC